MLLNYVKIKDIKPALSEYIRDSLSLTRPDTLPDDKTVHDIRVLMKKLRSAIKLARPMLDQATYSREYETFKMAGSKLSTWRETSVQRKLLKDIRKRYPEIMNPLADNEKIAQIMKKQEPDSELLTGIADSLQTIHETLNKSYYRIRFLNTGVPDTEKVLQELEKSYNIAKERYLIARISLKAADLHEFRKRAKDLLYQLYFFRPLKPSSVKSLEKRLDNMTQNLGKFNDIALLKKYIGYKYTSKEENLLMNELVLILLNEQERYLSKVWPSAYRIFRPSARLMDILGFSITAI